MCSALLSSQQLNLCCFFLLRWSPFFILPCGNLIPRSNLWICPTNRRWCVNREMQREPSVPSTLEPFLFHSWMFAKEMFWFNCSLLDYVIMAFEFFIRSFLSWSLGLRGTCFLAFDVFEKSGYLYHCSSALILWLLLWGAFWCAELSFVCVCCMRCLCGLFLYWAQITPPAPFFASYHESRQLLTSSFGKLVFAESCTETFSILGETQYCCLEGMDGIAGWHCSDASVSPQPLFPVPRKKILQTYQWKILTFCYICSFLMILIEVPGEKDS